MFNGNEKTGFWWPRSLDVLTEAMPRNFSASGKSHCPCSLRFFKREKRIGNARVNFRGARFYDRSVPEYVADYDSPQHISLGVDRYRHLL